MGDFEVRSIKGDQVPKAITFPVAIFLAATTLAAQSTYKPSHTPDGYPDLEGVWNIGTVTPFERPADLKDKPFFTPEESRAYEKAAVTRNNKDQRQPGTDQDVANAYNDAWWEQGTHVVRTLRTSVLIDPPDGRMPALTPAAQKKLAERRAILARLPQGPEDRSLAERCLFFGQEGPPFASGPYNNNYRIIQAKDYVAINIEPLHDTRVIPLDGSPHLPPSIQLWLGDSRGHYDGDALVIDTTNFSEKNSYRGSDGNLHVVERISRLDAETLVYRFTVEDPTAFTRPFTGEYTLGAESGPIYEYACHEGNYALGNMLKGARVQEGK
jgi:hypothetical protein